MNILLLGLPGAGKGTHGEILRKKYNIYHLSSGKAIRNVAKQNTSLGTVVKRYIDRGKLVPDEIMIKLMRKNIIKLKGKDKLLDGFPRNMKQVQFLDDVFSDINEELNVCILLQVSRKELITRLKGRRVCKHDGTIYHVEFDPPKKEGICDKCGGSLFQRKDDKKEIIKKKIKKTKEKIDKIKKYYKKKGILEIVNGSNKSPEKVEKEIEKIIEEL